MDNASKQITHIIAMHQGWKGEVLAKLRGITQRVAQNTLASRA